jgi:hypothetical protein
VLEEGGISEGKSEPVFIGQISVGKWLLLGASDRRKVAEEIRDQLHAKKVRAAMVMRGDRPAVQIDGYRVVFVE